MTLALGIGASTAMFSVINGVLLRPLPYPEASHLVRLTWRQGGESPDLTAPQFKFYRDHSAVFQSSGAYRGVFTTKLQSGKKIQWVKALSVTEGFFPTLGIVPVLGRNFVPEENRLGGPEAVIVTHALWKNAFGSDPNIIGRQVELNDESFTVAGVLPAGFQFVRSAEAFIPLRFTGGAADLGSNTSAIARLKPGVTLARAQAEMAVVFKRFAGVYRTYPRESGMFLIPYRKFLAGDFRASLLMLLGAVGFLLLIACSNVASLLLARATSRQKEISIRLAMGASRFRLFRQFFVESLLLATAGGAAGIAGAVWMLHAMVGSIPWDLPATDHIALDVPVLIFTLLIAVTASIAFGLASFFQTSKLNLNSTLKEGWSSSGSGAHSRLRQLIVAGEVALSLIMLVGAGLLIKSLYNLYRQPTGFSPRNLYAMETPFDKQRASSATSEWSFDRALLARIQAIPGVRSAAEVNTLPVAGQFNIPVQREGHPAQSIGGMQYRTISPGFFATMKTPLLSGRVFTDADTAASQPVVIISESLARKWWGNRNPIGDRIVVGMFRGRSFADLAEAPRAVIGVVGDVRAAGLDVPMQPTIYIPTPQAPGSLTDWLRSAVFVVRTSGVENFASALRKAVAEVDSGQRVGAVEPVTEVISGTVSRPRFNSMLLGIFAGLALVLTAVGLYGVISYWVEQRTHEIGVRMALGARQSDVLRLVVRQGLILALTGVAIGVIAALLLARLISSLLYGVKSTDPLTFIVVSLVLLGVALLASYIPARRAMNVDPMVALRHE